MGDIGIKRQGPIVTLTLANPGKANALDLSMLDQLGKAIEQVEADPSVRVVVLRGTPGGTFSSGADIAQWGPMTPEAFGQDWLAHGNSIFRRFESLRCPTLAVIEGLCFGGGLELALCADLRLGTQAARLRFPEVGIGAIPGWEGGNRLARLAGLGRAMEAVLTAKPIDASTAERWGVLNEVCTSEELDSRLAVWVGALSVVSPRAAAIAKQGLRTDGDTQAYYAAAGVRVKASPDAQIGLDAFFKKTAPVFP